MKKILGLVLAVLLCFSLVSVNATEEVKVLTDLGIITGYEDGTFKPNQIITRAEMAKLLACVAGADGSMVDEVFSDVPATHWANGYINYGYTMGAIAGRGDGTFDPEGKVTFNEATKMIVSLLGYDIVAAAKGGYPKGYLYVADNMLKLTKGIAARDGSRQTVATLLYNALEAPIMEPTSWSEGDLEFTKGDRTLLKDYLEITKAEGIVTETFYENFTDKEDTDVTIAGVGTFAANDTGAENYFGYSVIVYINDDDELVAIAPKNNENDTLEITFDKFENCNTTNKKNYVLFEYYEDLNDEEPTTAKYSDELVYYVNGVEKNSYTIDIDKDGFIRYLDNDGDNIYDFAFVEEVTDEYVVKAINEKSYKITGKKGSVTLDPEDEDQYITFIKNGEIVDFETIAEDDVLSIVELYKGNVKKVYISSETVAGRVTSTTNDKYKIGNNRYHKSESCGEIAKGDEGIFYLNYNGKIAYKEAQKVSGGNYAFVLDVDSSEPMFDTTVYTLLMLTDTGKWIEANFAEKVTFYKGGVKQGVLKLEDGIDNIAALSNNAFVALNDEITLNELANYRVIKYTLNSKGEITAITIPLAPNGKINEEDFSIVEEFTNEEYDANRDRFAGITGKGTLDKNSTVFVVEDEISTLSKKSQITIGATLKDEELYTGVAFDCVDGVYQCMVITNTESAIADDAMFIIIKEITEEINDDDEAYYVIEGYCNGEEITYETVATDEFDFELDTILEGNVIEVAFDKDNLVNDVKVIEFSDYDAEYDYEDEDGIAYYYGFLVDEELDGNYTFVDEHEINIKNANITYVDTTGRKYKYELNENIEDYLDSIIYADEDRTIFDEDAMNEETVYTALVKVVDGYAIDIVIYGMEYEKGE